MGISFKAWLALGGLTRKLLVSVLKFHEVALYHLRILFPVSFTEGFESHLETLAIVCRSRRTLTGFRLPVKIIQCIFRDEWRFSFANQITMLLLGFIFYIELI